MKQQRTKPKPTRPKEERRPLTGDEWEHLEMLDWIGDCKLREWKKSKNYKLAANLAERFKKKST